MEIRDISSIYEIKKYIESYDEKSFIDFLRNEQQKHEKKDLKKFKKNYLESKKEEDSLIKYIAYKYWPITRIFIFLHHRIKNEKNSKSFYDMRFFYNRYKELAYPIIEEDNNIGSDEAIHNIYKNIDNYIKVLELLEDEKSKDVLFEILKCRLTRDIDCIVNIYEEGKNQYFNEEIIGNLENEVFVDAGGYTGDTSQVFLNKCKGNKKIYIYEPSDENLKVAKQRLATYFDPNISIVYRERGLSNTEMNINFIKSGSSSRIIHGDIYNSKATEIIRLVTLDDDVEEKVTFIKMDIEGEESKALEGSKLHIQNNSPKLAICVYHKFDDLWKLPLQINSYNQNYKMFLRHYDKTRLAETVLYCIPK